MPCRRPSNHVRETAPQCNLLGASPRVRALPCRVRRVAAPAAAAGGGSPNGPRRVIGGLIRKTVGLLLGSQLEKIWDTAQSDMDAKRWAAVMLAPVLMMMGAAQRVQSWLTDDDVSEAFAQYTRFEEFVRMAQDKIFLAGKLEEYREAFRAVDAGGNGTISATELYQLFETIGHPITYEKLVAVMEDYDVDHSGVIDFGEFLRMFRNELLDLNDILAYIKKRTAAKAAAVTAQGTRITVDQLTATSRGAAGSAATAAAAPPAAAPTAPPGAGPKLLPGGVNLFFSEADLDAVLASNPGKLVVLMASVTWCRPCKGFQSTYEAAAKHYKDAVFLKFYGNSNEGTKELFKERLKCRTTPSFFFFRDVCRKGGVQETLELGDSLTDIGVGTRLVLLPADAAHGSPGDWAWLVSAFKTPPRMQPAASDATTPAALTGACMLMPPTSAAAGPAAAPHPGDDMATPPVPRALLEATAAVSAGTSAGCTGKRAAEQGPAAEAPASPGASAAAAQAGATDAEAPASSAKRQRLEGCSSPAYAAPAAQHAERQQEQGMEQAMRLAPETQPWDAEMVEALLPGSERPMPHGSPAAAAALCGGSREEPPLPHAERLGSADASGATTQQAAPTVLPPTQASPAHILSSPLSCCLPIQTTAQLHGGSPPALAPAETAPASQPAGIDGAAASAAAATASSPSAAAALLAAAAPSKRSGRSAPAGAVATDMVGSTADRCRELLGEAQALLLDREGGLQSSLATAQRAAAWAQDLAAMQERSEMRPVVIGVVGDTGAGKSSCLNALLGEEEVLPQSGMRACTACVVEVSYAPGAAYTADIEFMTGEEWAEQVRSLWEDLLGEDGLPQIMRNPERNPDPRSMHGAAQTVLESVLGRGMVRHPRVSLENLLDERNAATRHLGQTLKVREFVAKKFRKQIGKYVDSNNRRDDVATWPLVKVCRIRHSWPVLATGAMLVDLPGVRDANAAPTRNLSNRMQKCSAIWVCADITRAVDNKTAKDLLGESFRRQMMMDGQFGSISFICSKSDNVMPREVIDGLGVDEICARTETSLQDFITLENQILAKQDEEAERQRVYNRSLRANKKALKQLGDCEARLQVIRELISARGGDFGLDDDLPGARPGGKGGDADGSDDEGVEEGEEDEGGSGSSEDEAEDQDEDTALSRARKDGFREGKRRGKKKYKSWGVVRLQQERRDVMEREEEARQARQDAERAKKGHRASLDGVKRELHKLQLQMNGICSRARNAYSKEQLKRDFKEGIEAVEGLSAGGSRAAAAADIDLPVYCISARDAQKLEGRCRKDGPVGAFSRLEHTEVPALRGHVHDIARRGRIHTARSLAASLSSFLVSTALLLRDQRELDAEVGASVKAMFDRQTWALQKGLQSRLEEWGQQLDSLLLSDGLSPALEAGAARAEAKAAKTASHWGDPPRQGGYYWGTYKATVKRGGDYTGGVRGEVSFNGDLSAPLLDAIVVDWDNAFGAKIEQHLRLFRARAEAALAEALEGMRDGLQKLGLDSHHVERLCAQALQEERRRLQEGVDALMGPVGEKQRDLSRDVIKPTVKEHMSDVYAACTAEVGSGQFDRMRGAMRAHVEAEKGLMFKDATRTMKRELLAVVIMLREGVGKLAAAMLTRLSSHFSVLWERPPSNEAQRAVAVTALTAMAQQAEQ
ncbi:hypothetical protein ABPG77_007805, partial [Micractinium sp. CCAP 211/92]